MELIRIYQCLCDLTRLRILHLLRIDAFCVSDLQDILELDQVKISKHLAYMKRKGVVDCRRVKNRKIYSLPNELCQELSKNLCCLQDCAQENPIFLEDRRRLQERQEVRCLDW